MYFVRTKKRGIGKEKKELAEEKKGNSGGKWTTWEIKGEPCNFGGTSWEYGTNLGVLR
jgi:hypothetical protein